MTPRAPWWRAATPTTTSAAPARRGDRQAEDDGSYERAYDREAALAVPTG